MLTTILTRGSNVRLTWPTVTIMVDTRYTHVFFFFFFSFAPHRSATHSLARRRHLHSRPLHRPYPLHCILCVHPHPVPPFPCILLVWHRPAPPIAQGEPSRPLKNISSPLWFCVLDNNNIIDDLMICWSGVGLLYLFVLSAPNPKKLWIICCW
jgi:hypothetical protein